MIIQLVRVIESPGHTCYRVSRWFLQDCKWQHLENIFIVDECNVCKKIAGKKKIRCVTVLVMCAHQAIMCGRYVMQN